MDIVIGPVLKRPGGYGFRRLDGGQGLTRGYPYRRVEDAYYAWRAEIRASAQGRVPAAMVCQTLDEFIVKSTGCETLAAALPGLRGRAVPWRSDQILAKRGTMRPGVSQIGTFSNATIAHHISPASRRDCVRDRLRP